MPARKVAVREGVIPGFRGDLSPWGIQERSEGSGGA
jgi:hypothetical protein